MPDIIKIQKDLCDTLENICDYFASKKYLNHGTSEAFQLHDKYARVIRDQLTKETKIYSDLIKPKQTEQILPNKSPLELYSESLEEKISVLEMQFSDLAKYVLDDK